MLGLLAAAIATEVTPEQQVADFDQLWAAMDQMHPSLHLHTSKEELDAIRADVRGRLDVPRSDTQFWKVLMESVEPIGCGHTTVYASLAGLHELVRENHLFPYDLVVLDDALHLDPRKHPEAGRLISVNDMPADAVLDGMRRLTNSDARAASWQDFRIDEMAPFFLPIVVGPASTYALVLERDGERIELEVQGIYNPSSAVGADPTYDGEDYRFDAHAVDLATGEKLDAKRPNLDGRALLLTFDDFPFGGTLRRKIIKPLKRGMKADVAGVIIDLRRNGGGSPWPAFELFGHFIDQDELVYTHKQFRWPYYAEWKTGGTGARYEQWTREEFAADLEIEDGLYDKGYGDRASVEAREPRYDGPVVVLTAGNTFSTGADMASLLKRNGRGQIVGTPTGGGATLQTSGAAEYLVLEHSGVRASIPLNRSVIDDPDGTLGRGPVMPDHPVELTVDDLRTGNDRALRTALDLLAQ